MSISLLNCVFFLALVCTVVPAATIYDSGTASQTPPKSGLGMTGGGVAANQFSFSNIETIRSVTFYTLECCNTVWSGTISYYLFTGGTFTPSSSAFEQGSISLYQRTEIYSDSATNKVVRFEFDLITPVTLAANTTYWLGLGLTDGGSGPGWNSVIGSNVISARAPSTAFNWVPQASTGAFSLSDTNVQYLPEPGSVWLLLGGAGLMALHYRRTPGK
jgi:hypothetical protein